MFPVTKDITFTAPSAAAGSKTYRFDFTAGDFVVRDGKLAECDGLEAIKVWIEKILRTEKDRFHIYFGTEYGCRLEDLIIGSSYSTAFVEAELKREIEEAMLQNPCISSVSIFKITRSASDVTIEMEVTLGDTGGDTITVTV